MFKAFIHFIVVTFCLLRFSACNSDAKEIHIVQDTELDILVKHTFINRGIIYLNDTYFLRSWCSLLSAPPDWLKKSVYRYERKMTIKFGVLNPPFQLIKNKGEEEFYIIKHRDTLRFKLENSFE